MTIYTPLWLQNGSYSARVDRQLIDQMSGGVERITEGLVVTQHSTGDLTLDVSAGRCFIKGDDQSNQGMYEFVSDDVENIELSAAPGSQKRIDVICARVNDTNAGGPSGDDGTFVVVEGTPAGSPSAPAVPATAIPLVQVLRTAGDGPILTSMLTDVGPRGKFPIDYGTAAPSGVGPLGGLYAKII